MQSTSTANILLVDDDWKTLMAMEALLAGPGRAIVKAQSGQQALRCLLQEDFALILLDVRMPGMDGFETAALIRQRERSRYTPIIFLSAVDTLDSDVLRGVSSGAVDYLFKPVVPEVLKTKVGVFVDLFHMNEQLKQQAVRQTEERFRLLVESLQDYAIFMIDPEGRVTSWNTGAERIQGFRYEEIIGQSFACFYTIEDQAEGHPACALREAAAESRYEEDGWRVRKDGSRFWANAVITALRDEQCHLIGFSQVTRDLTERKRVEEQVLSALKEKEVLLKEIHHRVKNNLQVISSMLSLQERSTKDRQAVDVLRESQNRIRSIALIHEKLYQSKDLARVDFAEYVRQLANSLLRSYRAHPDRVTLSIRVADVFLDIDRAIPCGLILNELVSNSLKHAFPEGKIGEIRIDLSRHDGDHLMLVVADNGVGLPGKADIHSTATLGLQLVETLTEQLGGSMELIPEGGTEVRIAFAAHH
ncbi:MAG: PAS domain S-box protein [Deltaproteobacteria bacterium]|nr:PAS domain S-box protein [Deltaproteobacteria bacterium]